MTEIQKTLAYTIYGGQSCISEAFHLQTGSLLAFCSIANLPSSYQIDKSIMVRSDVFT